MEARYKVAQTLPEFIETATEHGALWHAIATRTRAATIPDDILARAALVPTPRNLLVLLEDWCGDAINTVPVIDAFVARVAQFSLRVLSRDANDDLMQAHLSPRGGRAIPVVIVYDAHFSEVGWWGSRPAPLQRWRESDEARALTKPERYAYMRRWYVQDRGVTTLNELLDVLG